MKVYDPAERIVYVHLASLVERHAAALRTYDAVPDRLPVGYANQSPRTRVRRDAGRRRADSPFGAEDMASEPGVTP